MIGAEPAQPVDVQPDRFVTVAQAGALAATLPPLALPPSERRTVLGRLLAPVDAASLAVFRIAFGGLLLWEVWKYVANGWIARYYVDPAFHFTYDGFEWVQPWPGPWMYVHFVILGVLAACIALGACYRLATALFFLGFSYVFLLEQARYLNHLYLVCLLGFLLIIVPAHRALSFDAWLRPRQRLRHRPGLGALGASIPGRRPVRLRRDRQAERRLAGRRAVRTWLIERSAQSVLGPWLAQEWLVSTLCYGGLLFDLAIVPLLLWRRTRAVALVAALAFHLTNAYLFTIGIFPWLMIAATLLFLPPDWPRRVGRMDLTPSRCAARNRLRRHHLRRGEGSNAPSPSHGAPSPREQGRARALPQLQPRSGSGSRVVLAVLAVYVAVQLLVPLRHLLYPGDVAWTEEGHRFSWRMKLREKEQTLEFLVTAPSTRPEPNARSPAVRHDLAVRGDGGAAGHDPPARTPRRRTCPPAGPP